MRYADTDAMGVVYYGTYLRVVEAGRIEALRAVGASYAAIVESGLHSPVTEAHLRYLSPARFDDLLLIHARVGELRRASFTFEYEVRRGADDALLTTGSTKHAMVDAQTLRPRAIPEQVRIALVQLQRPENA